MSSASVPSARKAPALSRKQLIWLAGSDEMALGAVAALKSTGKLGQIKAGELQYTVLQPVASFSKKAVEEADSFLRTGKTGASTEKQAFNCILITKANVNDFIAPFQLKS